MSELYRRAPTVHGSRKQGTRIMDSALPPVTLDELSVLSRRAATVIDRLRERVFAPGTQKQLDLRFNVRTAAEMVGPTLRAPKLICDQFQLR